MMVRQLKNIDCESARELWTARFDDSEQFIDWFFKNRFRPNYSFGAFENGQLISVSHGCPMRIMVKDTVTPALMISGVSTREGYEGRGLMHRVIKEQMHHAAQNGIPLAFNKPVNIDTYASLGFVPCTDVMYFSAKSMDATPCRELPVDFDTMHKLYSQVMSAYSGSVVRDCSEFVLKMEDYLSDGAKMLLSADGYCIYFENENSTFIEEAVSLTDYAPLLSAVLSKSKRPIEAKLPPDCGLGGVIKPMCVYALCDSEHRKSRSMTDDLQEMFGYKAGKGEQTKRICFCIDEY